MDKDELKGEIISKLQETYIYCPDCRDFYDDDQYTCTTCWCEGGNGRLNVYSVLVEHPDFLINTPK